MGVKDSRRGTGRSSGECCCLADIADSHFVLSDVSVSPHGQVRSPENMRRATADRPGCFALGMFGLARRTTFDTADWSDGLP